MSKPSWDEAPEWAQWLACDFMGATFFEFEPKFSCPSEIWSKGYFHNGKGRIVACSRRRFENSLEKRP